MEGLIVKYFDNNMKDRYDYKIQILKDESFSIVFQPKSQDNWRAFKEDCEYVWFVKNYKCEFDDKFHTVIACKSDSIFKTFEKIFGKRIPNKKKYIKTLTITFICCLLISFGASFLLKVYGTSIPDFETTIYLGLNILMILYLMCFFVITYIFLNNQSKKDWFYLILNSTAIDILFVLFIQHFGSTSIYQANNLSDTIINIISVIIATLIISLFLIAGSYLIRKMIMEENNNRSIYFYLRNKILSDGIDELKRYTSVNKVNISDLIFSDDATNDIVGHIGMNSERLNSSMLSPFLLILFFLILYYYFITVLMPLTVASRVILVGFIIFRVSSTTYNGVKKDKLTLIYAIYHLKEILAGKNVIEE